MISITTILLLIWLYFIADFLLQTTWMSNNKWYWKPALFAHGFVYSLPFFILGWKYAIFNGLAHIFVDFFSSKATHALYENKAYHWFFIVIGFDQAIHFTVLLMTLNFL